jgi:hypothetical protein
VQGYDLRHEVILRSVLSVTVAVEQMCNLMPAQTVH